MKKLLITLLLLLAPIFAVGQNAANIALNSAAQTATVASADITNTGYRGAHVIVNVSVYVSGTFTPKIQGKDPVSGNYYDILVGPALSATGVTVLKVYPGIGTAANGAANDILPRTWRVQMVGATVPSATFSVSYFSEQ